MRYVEFQLRDDESTVWINANHVVRVDPAGKGASVTLTSSQPVLVREDPLMVVFKLAGDENNLMKRE